MEVFPTVGIAWRYRYRLNGNLEKLTLGKYPALTLKNARRYFDKSISKSKFETKSSLSRPNPYTTDWTDMSDLTWRELQVRPSTAKS